MFNFSTILGGIYDWLYAAAGITVIKAEQNIVKPATPYLTFRIASIVQVGEDYISEPNSSGKATISGTRDFIIQVQGFGDGVILKLETARSALQQPAVIAALTTSKIVIFDRGAVENITGIDESEYEERASLDISGRSELITSNVDVGLIKIVNGVAEYNQPGRPDRVGSISIDTTT